MTVNSAFTRLLCTGLLALLLASAPARAAVVAMQGSTPQRATALVPFANPIAVRVLDAAGMPVAGASVTLATNNPMAPVASTGCNLDFMIIWVCQVQSDAQGVATFPQFQGLYAGSYVADVRAYQGQTLLGSVQLAFTVDPRGVPALVDVLSGVGQAAVIGTPLPQPFVVRLQRANGSAIAGAKVFFSPMTLGPGGFAPSTEQMTGVFTDSAGRAVLPPIIAGWGTGEAVATVTYIDDEARVIVVTPLKYSVVNAQGGLNLVFQGMWWSGLLENGWGMSVVQHQDRLFNVMFVYDPAGKPTWYVQPDGHWVDGLLGGQLTGKTYSPRGSPWFAYDASRFDAGNPVGDTRLMFRGEKRGTMYFGHTLPNGGLTAMSKELVPQEFGSTIPAAPRGVSDMWWGGTQQNGWGIAIHESNGALFSVWFTYDEFGMPTWFVMPGGEWRDADTYAGTIYRTIGSPWLNAPYNASNLQVVPLGTFSLRFAGARDRATLSYDFMGRSGQLALERQGF